MRIVHIITRLIRAGADENTVSSCLEQAKAGHEVILIHGAEFDPHYYEAIGQHVRLIEVKPMVRQVSPVRDVQAFRELRRLIRELRPDVVHTHTSKAGILGRFAAAAEGTRRIVHGVHIVPFINVGWLERLVYLVLEKAAARTTHAFVDVSRGMRDICLAEKIGRPDQHHVIHSGFDLHRFHDAPPPEDWRAVLGLEPDAPCPPVIVMMGVLVPRKRQLAFIESFRPVIARHPDCRLVLVGEGNDRKAIEALIDRHGLGRNVRLAGFRDDPQRMIALATLCALTSTREGLPRVIMQYLAGGKPCVATDLPGLDEVLVHDRNGIVVGPDDLDGAAQAISALLADPAELARLTAGARATDLSSWDVQVMGAEIERVYQLCG